MVFVDTGFLVALADPRDELHSRAVRWANQTHERRLVTDWVLVETMNLLSWPAERAKAHALLKLVRTSPDWLVIPANADAFESGVRLHREREDKSWSLTDCLSFAAMEQHGVRTALAYDGHFEQAGFKALLRYPPESSLET